MSEISDSIAAANASADAAIARVQADLDADRAKIADLQAQVDAGNATPEDKANLAALQAKLDALDPTVAAVLPPA